MVRATRTIAPWACLIVAAVLVPAFPGPAAAAIVRSIMDCESGAAWPERLVEKYNEIPTGAGRLSSGKKIELWRSSVGTYTIVMIIPPDDTWPDGAVCILAAGGNWINRDIEPPPPRPPGKRS